MLIEIVKYGHAILRAKGRPVGEIDGELRRLAEDMLETMREANGVGLAAQQVGLALQMAVVDITGVSDRPSRLWIQGEERPPSSLMPLVLIDPKIELAGEPETGVEGCLSFPEINADITRPGNVRVTSRDIEGNELRFEAAGLLSRAIQHEFDHLQGVLFIDRMNPATRAGLAGRLKRLKRDG